MLTRAAVSGSSEEVKQPYVVVTICSKRKRSISLTQAKAQDLSLAPLTELAAAWLDLLESVPRNAKARDLYAGRAFRLATCAADAVGASLYVISAGLGLINGDVWVPAYDLTVSGRGPDSIATKVKGVFDPAQWFAAVQERLDTTSLDAVFRQTTGPVLIALTQPYAKLVGSTLAELPEQQMRRVRIFGAGVQRELPPSLAPYVMPYDERLDYLLAGTRGDFAQRALSDFANHVLKPEPLRDLASHRVAVERRLAPHSVPVAPQRQRRTDAEIQELVRKEAAAGRSVTIRLLRDFHGVACEAGRFRRLTNNLQITGAI